MLKRFGIIAGLVLLAFLLLPRGDGDKSGQPDERNVTPKQEVKMKEALVTDDMAATDELCRNQCFLDLKTVSGRIAPHSGEAEIKMTLQALQAEHPHMKKLIYLRSGDGSSDRRRVEVGQVTDEADKAAAVDLQRALTEAPAGKVVQSPPLATGTGTYFVMGVPTDDGKGALVGVVHQQILDQVREHQMKNLRVVPYPAEGHFKIESVDTDTLRDVTVDHPEENEGTSHYHKNQVVVKFSAPPSDEDLRRIQSEIGAGPAVKLGYTYVFESARMEAQQMMDYFKKWNVEYAEPHYLYLTNDKAVAQSNGAGGSGAAGGYGQTESSANAGASPNDVLYSRYQWNLPIIETLQGWGIGKGSEDVKVAVVDTGVDLDHPDLKDRLLPGVNVVSQGRSDPDDDVGHGTHVAGVISALVNNNEGVAGMSWYNPILPVKVLDSSGSGSTYAVAQGVIWAADHGAKVINMSLGNYADAQFLHDAVRYAYDKDVVLIAASGNDNTERPGYPAAYPEVFAVAATDSKKNKASFSNYGDYIDVAAPGVSIPSTYPQNQYAALSGTSMASPHVAALAALIRSVNPLLKNTEVMDIMRRSAEDIGTPGKDKHFGYGQIDVVRALQMAEQSRNALSYWPEWLEREMDRIAQKYGS
ncbi:S8 family peptidase [Gorillibacterium sp. sgz5001074]|uniref:S8 family peptidase n=1 Tax=Gorillibacterium sp. sgz5001074 TaxID=3446695 RepID=UPI003F664C48